MTKINIYDPRAVTLKRMKKKGSNSFTTSQDNRSLILKLIWKNSPISRKQLAEETGLKPATITIILQELLQQGIVKEHGIMDGGNGRKVKSFTMAEDFYAVVVRITGVYVKIALYNINIECLYIEKIFFESDDNIGEAIKLIKLHLKEIEKVADKEKIVCIMVGVEHIYRFIKNDYFVWDKMRGKYCHIGKVLHDETNYKVFVNRAANFSAYEAWECFYETEENKNNYATMVNIQMSYDLESVVIVNGEIMYGMNGLCGQIQDMKIERDSDKTYKDVATVPVLLHRAEELKVKYPDSYIQSVKNLNIRDVIEGYNRKDALCRQVYGECIYHLGYFIAQILNWLDLDMVNIGDEMPTTREFLCALQEEVAKYCEKEKAERVRAAVGVRESRRDPALVGGAKYTFSLLMDELEIY
ncbi:ROK family transcriptional regulator [Mediterraneibacter sp. NSJ-55]|uniref:ROK family transcriptional regulator n=1 Tax=Mediterraneibacter hominis TaxID=2763054 RepID=A0A923LJR4_9FIRM|nr:ROK family transcriptional regulator [Mediterraneibacter hominis]MBC5689524.1 ROK family transcriptional regulator [Mediterraneibacter hominis]